MTTPAKKSRHPKELGLRLGVPTAVAPLVAVGIYGLVVLVEMVRSPGGAEPWLGWVLVGVAVTAYLVTGTASLVLMASGRRLTPGSPWTFGATGLLAGLVVALCFDLPRINLSRLLYYALAAGTGTMTAVTYRWLSVVEERGGTARPER